MGKHWGYGIALAALLAAGGGPAGAADFDQSMYQAITGEGMIRHTYLTEDDIDESAHGIGIGGLVTYGFDNHFFMQVGGNYDHAFAKGPDVDILQGAGMAFWRDPTSTLIGLTAEAASVNWGGLADGTIFRLGAYGQLYGSEILTLSGGAGYFALNSDVGDEGDGYYVQAALTYYLGERLAVGTGATFNDLGEENGDVSSLSFAGEYMIPLEMPTTVHAGYTYSDLNDDLDTHMLQFGLKLHFGGVDSSTLAALHRSGGGKSGDYNSLLLGY